jgi:hypothetical protein
MFRQRRGALSRRHAIAGAAGFLGAAAGGRAALAQPTAADPVSFYLGQTLALATLQAEAIGRLRPTLAVPAPEDVDWQATTAAGAGVIGAVAAVLGAMEAPAELSASVGELRLASVAYQGAAEAAQSAAAGDTPALGDADAGLAEGAGHILLWLDALTAETGNDWGDGLRSLTLGAAPAPVDGLEPQPAAEAPVDGAASDPGDGVPVGDSPEQAAASPPRPGGKRQSRLSRTNREDRVGAE